MCAAILPIKVKIGMNIKWQHENIYETLNIKKTLQFTEWNQRAVMVPPCVSAGCRYNYMLEVAPTSVA